MLFWYLYSKKKDVKAYIENLTISLTFLKTCSEIEQNIVGIGNIIEETTARKEFFSEMCGKNIKKMMFIQKYKTKRGNGLGLGLS